MKSLKFFKPALATTLPTGAWRLVLLFATAVSLIGYPKPASAATVSVAVGVVPHPFHGFTFLPLSVTIHPGDQVTWTWDSSGHSTTSGSPGMPNGIWDSGVRSQGATFTYTFNSVGTFPYYCTQGGETGQVIVTSALPTPTPTPTPIPTPTPTPTPTPMPVARAVVADFNGDSSPDFVLGIAATHETVVGYLDNLLVIGAAVGPTLPAGWHLVGAADFDGDGNTDYVLFIPATGQTVIGYLSGVTGGGAG